MATRMEVVSGCSDRLAAALRMRLCSRVTGGGCRRRSSRPSAPAAEWDITPRENIVGDGLFGGPAPEAANGVSRLTSVCPGGGPAAPKGMPSEASLELGFCECAKEL